MIQTFNEIQFAAIKDLPTIKKFNSRVLHTTNSISLSLSSFFFLLFTRSTVHKTLFMRLLFMRIVHRDYCSSIFAEHYSRFTIHAALFTRHYSQHCFFFFNYRTNPNYRYGIGITNLRN